MANSPGEASIAGMILAIRRRRPRAPGIGRMAGSRSPNPSRPDESVDRGRQDRATSSAEIWADSPVSIVRRSSPRSDLASRNIRVSRTWARAAPVTPARGSAGRAWPATSDRYPKAIPCSTGTSEWADSMVGDPAAGNTGRFRLRKASISTSQLRAGTSARQGICAEESLVWMRT